MTATPPNGPAPETMFEVDAVGFRYGGTADLAVDGVTFDVAAGIAYAILGPNGSGKSTLARLMLGELRPLAGRASYAGRDLDAWDRREIARDLGVVPQLEQIPFPLTVSELVTMGRFPHVGLLGRETETDRSAVREAMTLCRIESLADRPLATLSGGEFQRARIARALAQQPRTLVLDEPTTSLDLHFEMEIFELIDRVCREERLTVVVVTHNLNLAARYCQRAIMLHEGKTVAEGSPVSVLTRDTIERVYGWPVQVTSLEGDGPDAGAPQVLPLRGKR